MSADEFWSIRGIVSLNPEWGKVRRRLTHGDLQSFFGKEPVSCPNASQCYCKLYGLCNLDCEEEGVCKSQYKLPTYSSMPEGWPDYGWNGEWQNATEM